MSDDPMNHDPDVLWPVEVPEPDTLTAPWWGGTREHTFLLQTCSGCDAVQHPPREVCHTCGRREPTTWTPASGQANVATFTEVHRSPAPGLDTPYVVALVRLAEGPQIMTQLVGGDGWGIDDDVVLTWARIDDGRNLPLFTRPAPEQDR